MELGSSKPEHQEKAVKIFDICKVKNLNLKITWIRQKNSKHVDYISKLLDYINKLVN